MVTYYANYYIVYADNTYKIDSLVAIFTKEEYAKNYVKALSDDIKSICEYDKISSENLKEFLSDFIDSYGKSEKGKTLHNIEIEGIITDLDFCGYMQNTDLLECSKYV